MSEKPKYFISKFTNYDFQDAEELILQYLKDEGFGLLFTIDVTTTMKEKLNVDFKNYHILGVCNPEMAYKAFNAEDKIGVLMPCNVVVIEQPEGHVEVAAINPALFAQIIDNEQIECFANDARSKIRAALSRL
jgi:uncharacterized protein (DUF302 family)